MANLVVFHNVVAMTRVLQELIDEGYPVTPAVIARLSPYKTEHINRFGKYELHFDQVPPPLTEELRLPLAPGEAVSKCQGSVLTDCQPARRADAQIPPIYI